MILSMIAAMTPNRVIGTGHGGIPWHLPRDSQHFRDYTAGHHMILGRRTFEEMDGWFTTQTPLVVTRDRQYQRSSAKVVHSIHAAIDHARAAGESEVIVSGGASIYAMALPLANRLVLTIIDATIEGTAQFPAYNSTEWKVTKQETFQADEENAYDMEILTFERRVVYRG